MKIAFEKFETKGTKSLETVNKILGKSFVKKNSIFAKYLFSADILFNLNNLFRNFKYGIGSIMESMKIKRKQSIIMLPKQLAGGLFTFCLYILYGFYSSTTKFFLSLKNLLNLIYRPSRVQIDVFYDFEKKMKNSFFLFKALKEESKINFKKYFYHSKHLYFLTRKSMELGKI